MAEYKDFAAVQLFRTGAIGFHAFAKNSTANFSFVRDVYLDHLLNRGATLGEAQLASLEAARKKYQRGENVRCPMSYGDPALRPHIP